MSFSDIDRLREQQARPRAIMLWKALQPLKSVISFMNTGAHPDDETTSMLAALGLRDGIKLSHACSTRGEGGQNALGVETVRNLGVVRTREMERAAEVLDISQYWLSDTPEDPIFDFGFSKSGDETLQKWGEERTLERFVLILRRERPDIVCPTFLDIPGQHGHHRAMTRSAFKAVVLAADATAYPEQGLALWQVKKLYLPAWSGAGDSYDDDVPPPPATVFVDGSGGDPVLGADYAQIAQWSRAFHATQGMGSWVAPGQENLRPLHLAWAATGDMGDEVSIKDGLPATLGELAEFTGAADLDGVLTAAQVAVDQAVSAWPDGNKIGGHAVEALRLIGEAEQVCPDHAKAEVLHRLADKRRQLHRVLGLTRDFRARLSVSANEFRAGEAFVVSLEITDPDRLVTPQLVIPEGWVASGWQDGKCEVTVAVDAAASDPYPDTWFPDRANGAVSVTLRWDETRQTVEIPVELEERLNVLPAVSAELSAVARVVNLNNPQALVVSASKAYPSGGTASLGSVDGWDVTADGGDFRLTPKRDLQPGLYQFPLTVDGQRADIIHKLGYGHTGPLVRCEPAILRVRAMEVTVPQARIGYVGGGSDRADHWLREAGFDVVTLSDAALEESGFDGFDTLLIGIFAFRTRPVLASILSQLHDWVRDGGNLVTLYHRPWDNWDADATAMARLQIGKPSLRWRVTDEAAAVTHLQPEHELLNYPNKIGPDDWAGWVKERGLYFASGWDDAYTPLLSMADPDESALTGSLLSGKFGRGRHSHTSLILHHQMENLVPGAYRLMGNLLAPAGK